VTAVEEQRRLGLRLGWGHATDVTKVEGPRQMAYGAACCVCHRCSHFPAPHTAATVRLASTLLAPTLAATTGVTCVQTCCPTHAVTV